MMLYKQGRFWVEGASFQIPEGFYIETDPDVNYERGLAAWDPTRTHLYLWAISEEEEEGTKEALEEMTKELKTLSPPAPFTLNGLPGHWMTYGGKTFQNYEARFALNDEEQLVFSVEGGDNDISKIMESPEFRSALEGIRAD